MKIRVTFEADVSPFPAYDDIDSAECRSNLINLFYGSVLHTLDMRNLVVKSNNEADLAYLKASKEDEDLMKLLLNSVKVEKI